MPDFFRKAFLLFIVIIPACTLPKKTLPPVSERPGTEVLINIIERKNSDVTSLEGRMSSKIIGSKGKNSSRQLILLKKPSYLRLDTLTPFGQPALTMTTNGERIDFLYHSKRRFFSGMANGHNISGILPSSLNFRDITLILTGGIPLIDYTKKEAAVDIVDDYYRLTLTKGDIRQEILYSIDSMDVRESTIYGPGNKVLLAIAMNKYIERGKVRLPMKIKTLLPLENYRMEVKYSDVNINGPLGPELFVLNPPEGVTVEALDRLHL